MIRSTYEYRHSDWLKKSGRYKFCGMNVMDMTREQLESALAFMIQYAGDTNSRLNNALHNLEPAS